MTEKLSKEIESSRSKECVAALADRIVTGFLVPACQYQPTDFDHHEQWKPVNRAAGVIAGYAIGGARAVEHAQGLTDACLRLFRNRLSTTLPRDPVDDMPTERSARKMHAQVAGPKGLSKRVAECLLALGVGR